MAIVKGTDLRAMARDALDAVGGINSVVGQGQTVFIKPNFVTIGWQSAGREAIATGECTKPEILLAVAEECLKAGAAEVIIGDATQMPSWPWDKIMTLDRTTNMAAEAQRLTSAYDGKVTLACLDADSPEWVDVPSQTSLEKISVSSLVARADRIISIPVLKTHQWAQMTLSLKCFLGTTPLAKYGAKTDGTQPRIFLHTATGGIEQVFLDINKGVTPDLAIIDASIGVEGDGPALGGRDGGKTIDVKDTHRRLAAAGQQGPGGSGRDGGATDRPRRVEDKASEHGPRPGRRRDPRGEDRDRRRAAGRRAHGVDSGDARLADGPHCRSSTARTSVAV